MGKQALVLCGSAAFVAFGVYCGLKRINVVHISERPANSTQIPTKFETLETLKNQPAIAPAAVALAPDQLFAAMSPAVAQVHVMDATMMPAGQGTGFFVSADGLLVTNWHVIDEGAAATIITADGISHAVEGIVASNQKADLALLKVRLTTDKVATLTLAPQAVLPVIGTHVFAIGNPKGLTNTLSDGLVSGHRDGLVEGGGTILQISAPISPGSSGGPLMTADGAVVGVTSSGFSEGQNLNFAIPVEQVRSLIKSKGEPVALAPPAKILAPPPKELVGAINGPMDRQDMAELYGVVQALERGDSRTASRLLKELGPRQERQPLYWGLNGILHENLGNWDLSAQSFRKAIALNAKFKQGHSGLGRALMGLGRNAEAIESFAVAAKLDPSDVYAYQYAGIAAARLNDSKRALAFFDRAIKLKPKDAENFRLRGQALADLNRAPEALAAYDQALRLNPRHAETFVSRGRLYLTLKKPQQAVDSLKRAVALDADNATAYLLLGDALDCCKRQPEAIAAWVNATRFDEHGRSGKAARARLSRATQGLTRIE